MKPSVARRCKDQVREDAGRREMCVGVCACFFKCVCGDGEGETERCETEALIHYKERKCNLTASSHLQSNLQFLPQSSVAQGFHHHICSHLLPPLPPNTHTAAVIWSPKPSYSRNINDKSPHF